MSYRENVQRGLRALFALQNGDGGFPATQAGQASGCWTTADVLEATLISSSPAYVSHLAIEAAIRFLLDSQIVSPSAPGVMSAGGWPLYRGQAACTMATGHAVAALTLAKRHFVGTALEQPLSTSIDRGFRWLEKVQNDDGAWSAFPEGSASAREPRMVATFYACLPYHYAGTASSTSPTLRRALAAIRSRQLENGAWTDHAKGKGDASDTARALIVLGRLTHVAEQRSDTSIARGLAYILSQRERASGQWEIDSERVFEENAPAQLSINKNTPCDVLLALSLTAPNRKEFMELLSWMMSAQESDGLWYLCSPNRKVREISTWSTAEWITAVECAWSAVPIGDVLRSHRDSRRTQLLLTTLIVLVLLIMVSFTPFQSTIVRAWDSLPLVLRQLILVSIGLAIATNLAASFIYDRLKNAWFRRSSK